jgi:hypothetical protein
MPRRHGTKVFFIAFKAIARLTTLGEFSPFRQSFDQGLFAD